MVLRAAQNLMNVLSSGLGDQVPKVGLLDRCDQWLAAKFSRCCFSLEVGAAAAQQPGSSRCSASPPPALTSSRWRALRRLAWLVCLMLGSDLGDLLDLELSADECGFKSAVIDGASDHFLSNCIMRRLLTMKHQLLRPPVHPLASSPLTPPHCWAGWGSDPSCC